LSPRYALLYRPVNSVTLYATYGESYRPDTSGRPIFGTNERLKPVTGVLYEVGAKTRFFDGRLSVDIEVFKLDRENIVDTDPNNAGFVLQSGLERSKGYAISFNTDPLPGLTLFGGYGYTDGRVLENTTNPTIVGRPLRGTPKNSFTLFAKYRFKTGPLRRLGLGVGVRWLDDIPGVTNTTLVFPSYTVVDAQVNYAWRRYKFNLAVKNLFDEYYWANAGAFNANRAGVPLSYRASVRMAF
jgi:iron complex outermembrane receptor protein